LPFGTPRHLADAGSGGWPGRGPVARPGRPPSRARHRPPVPTLEPMPRRPFGAQPRHRGQAGGGAVSEPPARAAGPVTAARTAFRASPRARRAPRPDRACRRNVR